jgi:malate dehydrogenase (oxaloacetate-decarboxylating)(NADP+)
MNILLLPQRVLAITDTYVNEMPSAEDAAEIAVMAADELKRFGIEPKVALLSHSNFGSARSTSSRRMREARDILRVKAPDLQCDGEMHGDSALSHEIRERLHPDSTLHGEANLLVMPNLDAANIAFNLLKVAHGDGVSVGPILLGSARAVHILTPSASVRRLVNITALAVVDAMEQREGN